MFRHSFCLTALLVLSHLLLAPSQAEAQVYDLSADWSSTSNSNGVWSYGTAGAQGQSITLFTQRTDNYLGIGPGWEGSFPSGLAQNTGSAASLFDLPVGAVAGHTPSFGFTGIAWTAPKSGIYDVTGGTWRPNANNPDRHEAVSLFINSSQLFDHVPIPNQDAGYNSGHVFSFDEAIVAGGGSTSSLRNIPLTVGDTIILYAVRLDTPDFVAMNFRVTTVPAPSALAAFVIGAVPGAAVLLRRRRKA